MNECILVVDDDREIVGAIAIVLEREGYTVRRAYDGLGAVEQALDPAVRLILIDVMMPKLDGLSALMRIRDKRNLPVIVLSAKSEDTDKILGLSMGADDYVTKPYNPQELAARVRSQLRRYTLLGDVHAEKREGEIVNGRLSYDPERRELKADGELVKLTATELKIVDLLMRNPGRVFPAEEIYQRVWQSDSYACENTVMVHIRRIREKIELNPKEPDYTEFVKQTPADTVVLTLACGKYRFNDLDLGTIGGLPRLMDVGQCNDAYGAVKIALALAEAFGCGVNDLPLSLVLSWYEQKAVCILLTLLHLGIKNIRLGPTLPAFISPNVLNYLVENFGIAPITTPEEDLKQLLK